MEDTRLLFAFDQILTFHAMPHHSEEGRMLSDRNTSWCIPLLFGSISHCGHGHALYFLIFDFLVCVGNRRERGGAIYPFYSLKGREGRLTPEAFHERARGRKRLEAISDEARLKYGREHCILTASPVLWLEF